MDVKAWISVAAAVIALGSLVLAYLSRRDARNSAISAKDGAAEANRRADAANLSAERAAAAAERMAATQEAQLAAEQAARERYVPPWRLTWARGDTYNLENNGLEPVYDVRIGGEVTDITGGTKEHERVDAQSGVRFMAARSMQTVNDNVTVTWRRDHDGEHHIWSHPLPSRGPR